MTDSSVINEHTAFPSGKTFSLSTGPARRPLPQAHAMKMSKAVEEAEGNPTILAWEASRPETRSTLPSSALRQAQHTVVLYQKNTTNMV
ncbi:hypothetical protein XELAEV_18043716mg [Xenopus laevis]|uniref:Uncharacterized protein n=1 Tax=Xenopus laevis TaxID=8355 RepID=A0A974H354_XENLA|nr:hypothetical protein XELAEV_18043716mg [Xenopus laevis]